MPVSIDKGGSIHLPLSIRKQLGLEQGHHLDLNVEDGGAIVLRPVAIYPTVRLNDRGLAKLREARESGTGAMPDWMTEEMEHAGIDSDE